jgi:hypothetical protein
VRTLEGHGATVWFLLAVLPNDQLISASAANIIRLWGATRGVAANTNNTDHVCERRVRVPMPCAACQLCTALRIMTLALTVPQLAGRPPRTTSGHRPSTCTPIGKFWDAYTQGPDILEFHLGSRHWGHHHTSSAHPPRCLVRCE